MPNVLPEQSLHCAARLAGLATARLRLGLFAVQVVHKFRIKAANEFAKIKSRERGARPEDAVRLFDGLHRAALSLEELANSPGLPATVVQALFATSAASAALFAAGRRHFVAHLRLARGEHAMAHAMFVAAIEELEEARESARSLEGPWQEGGSQQRLLALLHQEASAWAVVAAAEAAAREATEEQHLSSGLKVRCF